jgi:hypothetical protein
LVHKAPIGYFPIHFLLNWTDLFVTTPEYILHTIDALSDPSNVQRQAIQLVLLLLGFSPTDLSYSHVHYTLDQFLTILAHGRLDSLTRGLERIYLQLIPWVLLSPTQHDRPLHVLWACEERSSWHRQSE